MDNSFFGIFHQARRILCQCPECGEISRLSEIQIKSSKKSKPTWLDIHQKNEGDFIEKRAQNLISKFRGILKFSRFLNRQN